MKSLQAYDELDTFYLDYGSITISSTKLGSGQFGEVWKGRLKQDNIEVNVAIKIVTGKMLALILKKSLQNTSEFKLYVYFYSFPLKCMFLTYIKS